MNPEKRPDGKRKSPSMLSFYIPLAIQSASMSFSYLFVAALNL